MAISIKEPKEPRALLFNGLAGVKVDRCVRICPCVCVNLHAKGEKCFKFNK